MSHSPSARSLSQRLLTATSLAMLSAMPFATSAIALTSQASPVNQMANGVAIHQGNDAHPWLMADKDDKDDKDEKKRWKDDRDHDTREVRVDLNRAKNLARQAAESANGGIRVYRAEDSMHGPAQQCPYVDNGDSWTFTFLGSRVGSTTKTIQSVVTVYKYSSRIVVAYNGRIRGGQQTQVTTFTTNQRTVLVDLLRGNCSCNNLLTSATRSQILRQSRSLPPGIQKQLLRGKGLPPGIAKKLVPLPKQVNTYINLPTYYDLVVVGSDVVLLDQVNTVVVDYISNVLL